jgi:hypothetical protein
MRNQRIGEGRHAGIECPSRRPQWLVRFQHHGELGEIEAADIDQRAGTPIGGDRYCMAKGIPYFAQAHNRKRRRQRQFGRKWRMGRSRRHFPRSTFLI